MTLSAIWGQAVSTSKIKGTVRDASGQAVSGAQVKATQIDTAAVRTISTETDGSYAMVDLPAGPYELEFSKPGLATYVQSGIILHVATNPTINVALGGSGRVQVRADAPMVESQSTGVGQVMDATRITALPLIRRQVTDLLVLAGATVPGNDFGLNSIRNYPTQTISIAGGLASGTTYYLDGAMQNDPYNKNLNYPLPFPDAVQEFKLETSSLPAQYGMHSAGAVNAVTRSGGDEFHGDVFEFLRNGDLDARNFFAFSADTTKRNQFGGTLGGPIRKNRIFFFGGFQATVERSGPLTNLAFVPTPTMIAGDFTAIASPLCAGGRFINLPASLAFINNRISPALLSSAALNIAKRLPAAADPCGRVTYAVAAAVDQREAAGRADYQLGPSHSLFARYVATNLVEPAPYESSKNLLATGASGVNDLIQTFAAGDTYLIGSNAVSTFRATLNRSGIARIGAQYFQPSDLGIHLYSYLPKHTDLTVAGGFNIGGSGDSDATYRTTSLQFGEDVSSVRGRHQISFGANGAHWNSNSDSSAAGSGLFTFNGFVSGLPAADFLIGTATTFSQSTPTTLPARQWYFGFYGQDSWKATPSLAVTFGVRWEPYHPMRFAHARIYQFDRTRFDQGIKSSQFPNAPAGLAYPGDPGFPDSAGMKNRWNELAPRVGLAWDPKGDGKISIQASFGMFYDIVPVQYHLNTLTAPPFFTNITLFNANLQDPWAAYPGGNPFPIALSANTPFPVFSRYDTFNHDTRNTSVNQWNLGAEKQIRSNWLVSAAYLGNHSIHLPASTEQNPALFLGLAPCTLNGVFYPQCSTIANTNLRRRLILENPSQGQFFSSIGGWDDGATSSYNGLLLSLERRLSRSVTATTNYTWSHCISDYVDDSQLSPAQAYTNSANRHADRGNCSTSAADHRHVVAVTAIAEMPRFSRKWMEVVAGGWRAAAIAKASSGGWITVTSGLDVALTGQAGQRPNQTLRNVYGDGSFRNFLNPSAFSLPAPAF